MNIKVHKPEPMPKSPLRILNEFRELKDYASESDKFPVFNYDRDNMMKWTGLLVPKAGPYSDKAFEVEIILPHEYPRQPPQLTFRTKIYHPNVSVQGEVKLEQIQKRNWSQKMRMEVVIDALIDLIENPNVENSQLIANESCAGLFVADKYAYYRKAYEHAQTHGLKPPEPSIFRKPRNNRRISQQHQEQEQPQQQQQPKEKPKPPMQTPNGKPVKKVVFNEKANQYSGPYIAVERLLKMTYDRNSLRKSSLKT